MPDSLATALIKDENLKKILMDVIKIFKTYLIEYERNLVETAVEDAKKPIKQHVCEDITLTMKKAIPEEIPDITGIDILKM